jgi:hypothetical protein
MANKYFSFLGEFEYESKTQLQRNEIDNLLFNCEQKIAPLKSQKISYDEFIKLGGCENPNLTIKLNYKFSEKIGNCMENKSTSQILEFYEGDDTAILYNNVKLILNTPNPCQFTKFGKNL